LLRIGWRNILVGVGLISVVLFLAGFVGFVRAAKSFEGVDFSGFASVDGVVVLTGGQDRIAEGVDVLASGRVQRLLISGVNENTTVSEMERTVPKMREFSQCCIDLGYVARNTIGNAEETRDWVRLHHFQSLIVVTSSYHMPRALAEIRHALPGTELVPHVVLPGEQRNGMSVLSGEDLRLYFVEYFKYLVAQVRFMLVPNAGLSSNGASKAAFVPDAFPGRNIGGVVKGRVGEVLV